MNLAEQFASWAVTVGAALSVAAILAHYLDKFVRGE